MTLSQIMQGLHENKAGEAQKQARTAIMIWILGISDTASAQSQAQAFLDKFNGMPIRTDAARHFVSLLQEVASSRTITHPAKRRGRLN